MLDEYRRRRDQLCIWLGEEPRLRLVKPAGAFYLFPGRLGLPVARRRPHLGRARAVAARRSARGADARRSLRRARLRPPLVRGVDGRSRSAARTRSSTHRTVGRTSANDDYCLGRRPAVACQRRDRSRASASDLASRLDATPLEILAQLETALGAEFVRTDDQSRAAYGTDALKRGHPADVVVLPGHDRGGRGGRAALRGAPDSDGAARRRHGLHRRGGADARRSRDLARADEPHPRDRRGQPHRRRRAQRHHRRSPGRRGEGRPLLSAGPGIAAAVRDRRQRGRVRRRPARVQVRHDQAVRARPRGGAADGRDRRDRRQGRQERRRLRPHAPAGRVRRHARDHHAGSSCGWSRSRRCRRRCARRSATVEAAVAAVGGIITRARRAGGHRAHRRRRRSKRSRAT